MCHAYADSTTRGMDEKGLKTETTLLASATRGNLDHFSRLKHPVENTTTHNFRRRADLDGNSCTMSQRGGSSMNYTGRIVREPVRNDPYIISAHWCIH